MGTEIRNDHSQEAIDTIHKKILEALELCGQAAEGYAQVNLTEQHAVDTGALRNSISHRVVGKEERVYIGTNIEYAPYIELGTGKYYPGGRRTAWVYVDDDGVGHKTEGMQARPYLKPAVTDHKAEYKKLLDNALRV